MLREVPKYDQVHTHIYRLEDTPRVTAGIYKKKLKKKSGTFHNLKMQSIRNEINNWPTHKILFDRKISEKLLK
jgi:hypothetical protein